MRTPSEADWGEVDERDLDAACAYEQFLGKSFAEAQAMFQRNALYYQEDLPSMPRIPFNYYAPAFASYLMSEVAEGDSDGSSALLDLVAWLLESRSDLPDPDTRAVLLQAAEHVASRQSFYEADVGIYGNFPERFERIVRLASTG